MMWLTFWKDKTQEAEKKKIIIVCKTKNYLKRMVSEIVVSSVGWWNKR